ncbi:MAG: molybdenum cofactor biosynthesis protein MoaE [Pseudomonadota bacterium]
MTVRLLNSPFDPGAELSAFTASTKSAGAVVSFCGIVRGDGDMTAMEIEHYPAMTEKALAAHRSKALEIFDVSDALILHRFGRLQVGETIMMVATAAAHRRAAFDAADFLMDYLKSRAPFWKKEIGADGATWVAAKDDDEAALSRWQT